MVILGVYGHGAQRRIVTEPALQGVVSIAVRVDVWKVALGGWCLVHFRCIAHTRSSENSILHTRIWENPINVVQVVITESRKARKVKQAGFGGSQDLYGGSQS